MSPSTRDAQKNNFRELNTSINKVVSIFGLIISSGFILLSINDIIDQAGEDYNYEKYRIKCCISTLIVIFFTLLYGSLFHKINWDLYDVE